MSIGDAAGGETRLQSGDDVGDVAVAEARQHAGGVDFGVGADLGDHSGDERAVAAFEVERPGRVVVGFVLVVDGNRAVGLRNRVTPGGVHHAAVEELVLRPAACPFSTTVRSPVSRTRICGRRRPSMFSRRRRNRGSSAGSAVDSITLRTTPLSSGLVSTTLPRKAISPAHDAGAPSGLPFTTCAPRKTWLSSDRDRRVEGGELADRLLHSCQRPAILAIDRLAFDALQANRHERQVGRRLGSRIRSACSLS